MRAFFSQIIQNRRGFTLVEMSVAILISLIIMTAVTGVFIAHSRTYTQHDDLSNLQQHIRGVMMTMPADFRLVGCDPTGMAGAGIRNISVTQPDGTTHISPKVEFEYTTDIAGFVGRPNDADGEIKGKNERVAYKFVKGKNCKENEDVPGGTLCRKVMSKKGKWAGLSFQPIAENIEALEFNYIMEDGSSKLKPPRARFKQIRAVQISMLARSEFADPSYFHEGVYTTASGAKWEPTKGKPAEAHHRRRLLVTTIQFRNMGYTK